MDMKSEANATAANGVEDMNNDIDALMTAIIELSPCNGCDAVDHDGLDDEAYCRACCAEQGRSFEKAID